MIRSVPVFVVAMFFFSFAISAFTCPQEGNSQTTTQSQQPGEAARLSATIADLYRQGKYDDALPLAKRVVDIERGLGPERPEVALALANVAELYLAKKEDGAAGPLFQQAAAIYERSRISSPPVSDVFERLAQLSFRKRKYGDAIMLLERSLAIREQSYGAESSQVAETLHELANVYQVDHNYQKSDPLYLRSITIKEKLLGRTDPGTVQAMKDYACLQAKRLPILMGKAEIKKDLTDAEKDRNSVIERASCWLYGFEQDCDKRPYGPRLVLSTVLNGRAIRLVQPPYPVEARSKRISGSIYAAVLIDENGNVIKATSVCGGHPELKGAAVVAARASKFTPTKIDDRAVQVTGMIVYRFQ